MDSRIMRKRPCGFEMVSKIHVPTGYICTANGERGKLLEFLSIGDYGKHKNLKADFLGLDKPINGVEHGPVLPLSEKWVITISSQYGCTMGCKFCSVPRVGYGHNATFNDLINQVMWGIQCYNVRYTKRLNLHYARMGEPTWNFDVIRSAYWLSGYFEAKEWGFHPVVSTMMPQTNGGLSSFLMQWLQFKECVGGNAGLQISVNTTDDEIRHHTMPHAMSLADISQFFKGLSHRKISGRKLTLNFALTDAPIDAQRLAYLFDPKVFLCKITPMHETEEAVENGLITKDGAYYPYERVEEKLKSVGFDVIVFMPSREEDESRITCGNAILAKESVVLC